MNAQLPPVLAAALAPFAPPSSVVHQIVDKALEADRHNNALKASGALDDRRHAAALTAQIERPLFGVRS
jgi:hypothetical protein